MRIYDIILTAGNFEMFGIEGDFLYLINAPSSVRVSFENTGLNKDVEMMEGMTIKPGKYTSLRIFSAVNQTVKILAGFGDVNHNRISGSINVVQQVSNSINNYAVNCNASMEIVPRNLNRKKVTIIPTNGDIFIGDDGVTTNNGMPIIAGSPCEIETSAAIYAIPSGAAVDIRVIEEILI